MSDVINYVCPNCGSEDYRKLSLIYQQGSVSGRIEVYSAKGLHLHRDSANISGATIAAESASPPTFPLISGCILSITSVILWLVGCVVAAVFFPSIFLKYQNGYPAPLPPLLSKAIGYLGLANVVLIPLWTIRELFRYPRKLRNWSRTHQCQRCGTYFRIEP
jgi:hypothetical protein